jgi:[NiFe] hydrogenase assembly HybE family chaperone
MTTEATRPTSRLPVEPLLPDPSPRLTSAFREVAERMEGLGFANPALEVEAVAFEPWQGHWLGVMVTPWFMNLVLLPRDRSQWQPLPLRGKRKLHFAAGVYEFIGADDPAIGEHQTCSLFSPMHDFEDQAAARMVARLAREALFDPANAEVPEFPKADLSPDAQMHVRPDSAVPTPLAPISKRNFLRGRLGGSPDVDRR